MHVAAPTFRTLWTCSHAPPTHHQHKDTNLDIPAHGRIMRATVRFHLTYYASPHVKSSISNPNMTSRDKTKVQRHYQPGERR